MRPRYWSLTGLAVVLAVSYVALFTDWLNPAPIGIVAQIRTSSERGFGRGPGGGGGPDLGGGNGQGGRQNRNGGAGRLGGANRRGQGPVRSQPDSKQPGSQERPPGVYPVSFSLDDNYQLTSVKVVKAGTREVLWHLVADGKQAPTKAFIYGQPIRSMNLAPGKRQAEPLQADVRYELQIAAGRHKGTIPFETKAIQAEPPVDGSN